MILGYPSLKNKNFGTFLGEIHRINPEILGYPRIPGYPLTSSLVLRVSCNISLSFTLRQMAHLHIFKNFFIFTILKSRTLCKLAKKKIPIDLFVGILVFEINRAIT